MTHESIPSETQRPRFRRLWPVMKWALFALVLWFVARRAWTLWNNGDVGSVTIHWPWLVAASWLYAMGWLPSVLFWHRLIHRLRGSSSRLAVAHAFFAGHLGKYIPGKASVLLIRAGLLAERGCRPGVTALTSTYETLVCMGVGAAVGLTLAPVVWPRDITARFPNFRWAFDHPLVFGTAVVLVCIVLVPPVAKTLGWITHKLTPIESVDVGDSLQQLLPAARCLPPASLLIWCFVFVATWLVHGLSLGCALRAVGVSTSLSDWLMWTGEVSSASVLGFVAVFAPGGLGIRELALVELLEPLPNITANQAVAASALLRAAWLAAEILMAAGLSLVVGKVKRVQNAK